MITESQNWGDTEVKHKPSLTEQKTTSTRIKCFFHRAMLGTVAWKAGINLAFQSPQFSLWAIPLHALEHFHGALPWSTSLHFPTPGDHIGVGTCGPAMPRAQGKWVPALLSCTCYPGWFTGSWRLWVSTVTINAASLSTTPAFWETLWIGKLATISIILQEKTIPCFIWKDNHPAPGQA